MDQFHVSAAGNTFIGAWLHYGEKVPGRAKIQKACHQYNTDGFFAVSPSEEADLRIVHYNQDGSKDGVCGNSLACAALIGQRLKQGDAYSIEAGGKIHRAFVDRDGVSVTFPHVPRTPRLIDNNYIIDTGVPHVVIQMPHPPAPEDVATFGHNFIRNWPGNEMINVTMFGMNGDYMHVATYEYGVWRVTGSCGTGILASFNVARYLGKVKTHVTAITPSDTKVYVYSEWNALTFKTPVESAEIIQAF
jgi:diaminopimelate epimerase